MIANIVYHKSRLQFIVIFYQKSSAKKIMSIFLLFELKDFYIRLCIITQNELKLLIYIYLIDNFGHNLLQAKDKFKALFYNLDGTKYNLKNSELIFLIQIELCLHLEECHHKKWVQNYSYIFDQKHRPHISLIKHQNSLLLLSLICKHFLRN